MMKSKTLMLSTLALLSLGLVCTGTIASKNNIDITAVSAESIQDYYSSIKDTMSGETLRNALNSLNNKKRKKTIGYKKHRNYFYLTEVVPGKTDQGKMYGFYDNALISDHWDGEATWNHEHIWPDSRGGGDASNLDSPYIEDDIHMIRPTSKSINSGRGNQFYAEAGAYDPGQYVAEYRGIAARIIMYCAIADTRLSLVDATYDSSSNHTMGKLSDLLKWNLEYLPTRNTTSIALLVEQNRNEVIYSNSSLQGNRNPFIDHPEYACRIWGNTNDETRKVCANQPLPAGNGISSLTLDVHEISLKVNETKDLTFDFKPDDATVFDFAWVTDNENVATVDDNGLVKAVGAGTATITLLDLETNILDTCVVTVTGNNGCGGSIVTTSVILSTISLLGCGLILIKKKNNV